MTRKPGRKKTLQKGLHKSTHDQQALVLLWGVGNLFSPFPCVLLDVQNSSPSPYLKTVQEDAWGAKAGLVVFAKDQVKRPAADSNRVGGVSLQSLWRLSTSSSLPTSPQSNGRAHEPLRRRRRRETRGRQINWWKCLLKRGFGKEDQVGNLGIEKTNLSGLEKPLQAEKIGELGKKENFRPQASLLSEEAERPRKRPTGSIF